MVKARRQTQGKKRCGYAKKCRVIDSNFGVHAQVYVELPGVFQIVLTLKHKNNTDFRLLLQDTEPNPHRIGLGATILPTQQLLIFCLFLL
jgi:hypothetical protein